MDGWMDALVNPMRLGTGQRRPWGSSLLRNWLLERGERERVICKCIQQQRSAKLPPTLSGLVMDHGTE